MGSSKPIHKIGATTLVSLVLASAALAYPVTTFTTNASGGFDAIIYPTLADGTFTNQSPIFSLPFAVNPGYVIIVDDPTKSQRDTSNWSDVIRFVDNGKGKATSLQMLTGGPDQSSYFPTLNKVLKAPHVFITDTSSANGGFTNFTDYSVSSRKERNYHFYTAGASAPVTRIPEGGSTLLLFVIALFALFFLSKRLAKEKLVKA